MLPPPSAAAAAIRRCSRHCRHPPPPPPSAAAAAAICRCRRRHPLLPPSVACSRRPCRPSSCCGACTGRAPYAGGHVREAPSVPHAIVALKKGPHNPIACC
ncbi:hypothetical protein VPH35_035934 [Triticum aestivum]|uniref:Uncharacterized protein n=1 Tax=Aegilops tauschii subsp. strangulata TaxID=200361 RepID=A0A453B4Q5_AEGTS